MIVERTCSRRPCNGVVVVVFVGVSGVGRGSVVKQTCSICPSGKQKTSNKKQRKKKKKKKKKRTCRCDLSAKQQTQKKKKRKKKKQEKEKDKERKTTKTSYGVLHPFLTKLFNFQNKWSFEVS